MSAAELAGAAPSAVEGLRLTVSGTQTSLEVVTSADVRYQLFTLASPDRMVLDILGARLGPRALPLPAGVGGVRQVRAANRLDGSVRLVLDLLGPVVPQATVQRAAGAPGNHITVALVPPVPDDLATAAVAAPAQSGPTGTPGAPLDGPEKSPSAVASMAAADEPPVIAAGVSAGQPPTTAHAAPPAAPGRDIVIAVDAGHGGKDPGAHGPRGLQEKDVTLRIARRLVDVINAESGMRGVLTRSRDEFVPLRGRMERARAANADLFISVHADAVRNRSVRGASVYVLNEKGATDEAARRLAARENAADLIGGVSLRTKDPTLASVLLDLSQNASLSSSIEVADDILGRMARVGTVRKPQVMQAPFMVLKSPDVPSVLIETAYISNPDEERRLDSRGYRDDLAKAIFAGVRDYFYRNPPRGTLVAQLGRKQFADLRQHVIRPGESLSVIAVRYNVPLGQLREANRLTSDRIAVGQTLRIPMPQET